MEDQMPLEQAVRNAVAAEIAAAGFYTLLAETSHDERAAAFFSGMAAQELDHARCIEDRGKELGAGTLPERPDTSVRSVETVMGWEGRTDITYEQALEIAVQAENNAELIYETWADQLPEPLSGFFMTLARTEEQHAGVIRELMDGASPEQLQQRMAIPEAMPYEVTEVSDEVVERIEQIREPAPAEAPALTPRAFAGHDATVRIIEYSPDGRVLATLDMTGELRLWHIRDHALHPVLPGGIKGVASVAFSQDGRTLVTGDDSGSLTLWPVQTLG